MSDFLPEAPLWVAVTDQDEPVGFMLLTGEHMDALFVDPDFRGCGIGKLLIEHALTLAPHLTTSVNEQNIQAVGFL
ncbi:acetyltransferase [Salmonella enterica subsp. arizonae]|uniref:Acetyltransferase n=1 Tax=Salmonella enterica subsp. arizonae TaxID=59203 RepID=A0A379TIG0_SALER|nr:acetyltransferase [Salmonella enterica subsp. arizonae]